MTPEDFDVILDRCLAQIAAGRETVDSCLRHYPEQAEQLARLLKIAEQARAIPAPAPLPTDKRLALEARLLQRAEQLHAAHAQPVNRPTAPRLRVGRRAVALVMASTIVVLLLLGSTVTASAASVPGDALYPIKRAAEQVQLTLASGQEQIELHLEFAQKRLQELHILADRGVVSEALLTEISNDTTLVFEQIPALPQDKKRPLLTSLTDFQDQELQTLEVMALSVQGDIRAKVLATVADSAAKRQLALDLLAGAAANDNSADNSPHQPRPTIIDEEALPGQEIPAPKPESTEKPKPEATPKAKQTPPGLADPSKHKPGHTPPWLDNQPTPHPPPEKSMKAPKQ